MEAPSDAYRYWRNAKFPSASSSDVLSDLKGDLVLRDHEIAGIAVGLLEDGLGPSDIRWPVIDLLAEVDQTIFSIEDFKPENDAQAAQRLDFLAYATALRNVWIECLELADG
jgi:hypothetical protein